MAGLGPRSEDLEPAAAGETGRTLRERVMSTFEVEVADPDAVERSVGPMRRIVDHRPHC